MILFRISDKPFFEDNPEALSIHEFKEVGDKAMKYIALVYMYGSPLRKLEIGDRKLKSIKYAEIERTPTGRPSKLETDLLEERTSEIKKAIEIFKEIDFDEDRDFYDAYCDQLNYFKDFLRKRDKSATELEKALKIQDKYDDLLAKKKLLAEQLELKEEEKRLESFFSKENDEELDNEFDLSMIEQISKHKQ